MAIILFYGVDLFYAFLWTYLNFLYKIIDKIISLFENNFKHYKINPSYIWNTATASFMEKQ